MTEIENIMLGLPYDTFILDPDPEFKDVELILKTDTTFGDGYMTQQGFVKKGDEYYYAVLVTDLMDGQVRSLEFHKKHQEVVENNLKLRIQNLQEILDAVQESDGEHPEE